MDGAFSHQDSLYAISWNSLVAQGSTAAKRFVFTVFRKSEMTPGTIDAVFRIFAWPMNIMLSGKWPHENWYGRSQPNGGLPLAEGWCGALCQIRGDWQFYAEVFWVSTMEFGNPNVLAVSCQHNDS